MMLQAVLLASLATVVLASICCAPQQWEGFKAITTFDPSVLERYLQSYSYDAINQRYAVSGNYTSFVSSYKEIWDYGKGTGFRINTEKQTCEAFAVTGTFPANCIPSGAVELGPVVYGYGTDSISTIAYQISGTRGESKNTIALVSSGNCVPVTSTTMVLRPGNNSLHIVCFNNIFPGIRDVSIFDPPAYCRKSA